MVDEVIIPSVEFSTKDIPSKMLFRNTKKISLKVNDTGITFIGLTVHWDEITSINVKFFNSNPYIQIRTKVDSIYSFYFENKFYYRHKKPWYGASEFITKEFVKILEEKNLFSVEKLESNLYSNTGSGARVHSLWNSIFVILPILMLVLAIIILLGGLFYGPQTQFLFKKLL